MNKSTMEFLKFFNESIKNIHVLTEEMYAQMQEARDRRQPGTSSKNSNAESGGQTRQEGQDDT